MLFPYSTKIKLKERNNTMSKVKYTKKMKDFLTLYGIEVEPVTKGKYSPEAIQFFQDQNDEYEFTIEDLPVSGSFKTDLMEYGEINNSDYFID
jgi:hypothetical protein